MMTHSLHDGGRKATQYNKKEILTKYVLYIYINLLKINIFLQNNLCQFLGRVGGGIGCVIIMSSGQNKSRLSTSYLGALSVF